MCRILPKRGLAIFCCELSARPLTFDRALRDPRSTFDRVERSSPKGSPIDFRSSRSIDRALRDPRSTFDDNDDADNDDDDEEEEEDDDDDSSKTI